MGKPVTGEVVVLPLPLPKTDSAVLAARTLWETERQQDTAALAELDRRMDEMDAGKNVITWAEAVARLDKLDQQGK
ncbi:MAG: hypothetical protein EBS05_05990 [Proteobacteria bacterium]|nr:hypothetical protein [Pseudomonadota bacterium]NDF00485.1 hypothetical protein [Verrucomicrobiota bacterium]